MNTLILPALNLIALLGFIFYKTKQPFKQYMKTRHQGVYEGLNRSKLQAAAAAQKQQEVEQKLRNLDAEKVTIAGEWKEREAQQIAALKDSSARVIAQMKKEAEQNRAALEVSMKAEILQGFKRNVIAKVEAKLKSALNTDIHGRLNQEFIQEVSKGANA